MIAKLALRLAALMLLWGACQAAAKPAALLSFPSVSLPPTAGRGEPIRIRVTAPARGARLPIVLFSHGATYSSDDYRWLADHLAANGFVVMQPTHLDSRTLKLPPGDPRQTRVWRLRRDDMIAILDNLDRIVAQAPALAGRIDGGRAVAIGHSYGGHTSELLLGATTRDPLTGRRDALGDRRILGGVLLSAPGGGDGLSPDWVRKGPFLQVDWSTMRKPTLVVVGDLDNPPMSTRGPVWHEDAFVRAPAGAVCLVALGRVGHYLGEAGHQRLGPNEPDDPASIAIVQQATLDWARQLVDGTAPRAWRPVAARLKRSDRVARASCR